MSACGCRLAFALDGGYSASRLLVFEGPPLEVQTRIGSRAIVVEEHKVSHAGSHHVDNGMDKTYMYVVCVFVFGFDFWFFNFLIFG